MMACSFGKSGSQKDVEVSVVGILAEAFVDLILAEAFVDGRSKSMYDERASLNGFGCPSYFLGMEPIRLVLQERSVHI